MTTSEALPVVELPERLDRPGRLGPFPSGGAALKFLLVGAVGALVALRFGPLLWTPFLAGGFLLAVHRRDGRSLDEVTVDYLRFRLRRRAPAGSGARPGTSRPCTTASTRAGRVAAGFEANGIPVAFLPPTDAARLYDQYRNLLRAHPTTLVLRVGRIPIRAAPFLPHGPLLSAGPEAAARTGYAELIELLAERRYRRRVRLLVVGGTGRSAAARVESEMESIGRALEAMGIPHHRLRGARLLSLAPGLRDGWGSPRPA
jgi:hypothetical protein